MIVIVDYGVGNLASVRNMLKRIGVEAIVSGDPAVISRAPKLILPGVGAFDVGMQNLAAKGFVELLTERVVHHGIPLLGICLGMQLLSRSSEEGSLAGLGWINAHTKKILPKEGGEPLRVPHMGWNTVDVVNQTCPLVQELPADSRFYFVHSYHVACQDRGDVLGTTTYGDPFTSMVWHKNIYGAQFHPEKSHKFGMAILKNFAERCGGADVSR